MVMGIDDKKEILELIKEDGDNLLSASNRLKDDKDIVLAAVEHNGLELECASDRLKDDKDVVSAAVLDNGLALEFASDRLKNDTDVVLQAVVMNDEAITYIGDTLKNNREFFKSLAELCGTVLLYDEGEAFRDDKEIVLKAIETSPDVTQCISDRLKDDEEVMLLAATRGPGLEFASDRLKNDEEFIKKLYSESYYDLEPLCYILMNTGCKLKSNSKFMLSLVEKYGSFLPVLKFIDKDIVDYKKIAKEALIKDINSMKYLKEELKNDKDFILDILKDIQMNYNVYSSLHLFLPDNVFNEISLELKLQDFEFDEELSSGFTDDELPF